MCTCERLYYSKDSVRYCVSEQKREPETNSTHIRRRVRESNPGHIGRRRALSSLRHPCSPSPQVWVMQLIEYSHCSEDRVHLSTNKRYALFEFLKSGQLTRSEGLRTAGRGFFSAL